MQQQTERRSAYGPQIDNAVIGSDVVECEALKNIILGNCFFPDHLIPKKPGLQKNRSINM